MTSILTLYNSSVIDKNNTPVTSPVIEVICNTNLAIYEYLIYIDSVLHIALSTTYNQISNTKIYPILVSSPYLSGPYRFYTVTELAMTITDSNDQILEKVTFSDKVITITNPLPSQIFTNARGHLLTFNANILTDGANQPVTTIIGKFQGIIGVYRGVIYVQLGDKYIKYNIDTVTIAAVDANHNTYTQTFAFDIYTLDVIFTSATTTAPSNITDTSMEVHFKTGSTVVYKLSSVNATAAFTIPPTTQFQEINPTSLNTYIGANPVDVVGKAITENKIMFKAVVNPSTVELLVIFNNFYQNYTYLLSDVVNQTNDTYVFKEQQFYSYTLSVVLQSDMRIILLDRGFVYAVVSSSAPSGFAQPTLYANPSIFTGVQPPFGVYYSKLISKQRIPKIPTVQVKVVVHKDFILYDGYLNTTHLTQTYTGVNIATIARGYKVNIRIQHGDYYITLHLIDHYVLIGYHTSLSSTSASFKVQTGFVGERPDNFVFLGEEPLILSN